MSTPRKPGLARRRLPVDAPARAALFEDKHLTPIAWNGADGSVRFRIDGTAKVVGDKVFAYDIRARDMPNWPQQQSHAFLLRATFADRPWLGLDLSSLEPEIKPHCSSTTTSRAIGSPSWSCRRATM